MEDVTIYTRTYDDQSASDIKDGKASETAEKEEEFDDKKSCNDGRGWGGTPTERQAQTHSDSNTFYTEKTLPHLELSTKSAEKDLLAEVLTSPHHGVLNPNYPRNPFAIERNRGKDPIFEKLENIENQVKATKHANWRLEKRFEEHFKEQFKMRFEERNEWSSFGENDDLPFEEHLEKHLEEKVVQLIINQYKESLIFYDYF